MDKWTKEQNRRFDEVWDSLEPEIRGDLERLFHRLNTIRTEAQLYRVGVPVLQQRMPERFWELWRTIGKGERWEEIA